MSASCDYLAKRRRGAWGEWEACSADCGGGDRLRVWEPCVSDECKVETESCSTSPCAWTEWEEAACSVTCGKGLASKTRTCPVDGKCIGASQETVECQDRDL